MASYTSRLLLGLTIPSIFSFLSVLWFLKKRASKQFNKSIQVENTSDREVSEQYPIANSMKLKDTNKLPEEQDRESNSSAMQLKETQNESDKKAYASNGTHAHNSKVKAKKKKAKSHENGSICKLTESITAACEAITSPTTDKENELTNGIEALSLSSKDNLRELMNETNGHIENGHTSSLDTSNSDTNCSQLIDTSTTNLDKDNAISSTIVQTNAVSEKVILENGTSETTEQNSSETTEMQSSINIPQACDERNSENQTDSSLSNGLSPSEAHKPLTVPVDESVASTSQNTMLESPVAKYCDSVGSNDSGKGASEFQFVLEPSNVYMVYEFEIEQELCGLLIGRQGRHVNFIKQETNANVLIKRHPFFQHIKICSVTGTEDEIFAALKIIRKRFPIEVYPSVTLAQINNLPSVFQFPETLKLSLPGGVSFEAMLTATVNAGHFFLHQPTHPTYHSLPALTTDMTAFYSQVDTPTLSQVAKGYVCVACLTPGWFRAEIDEVLENTDECRLKFLDYGGYATVPRTALRQIKYDFMNVPFQATECYLGSVTYREGETSWSAEATAVFEDLAQGQIVQGFIIGYAEDKIPYVHLYKITGATSIFINRELVNRGLARWVPMIQ